MASTRSFKNPGVFAQAAATVIPPTPIAGVAYRDAVDGADETVNGWRYGTRVQSQDWNQVMFLLTSMTQMLDTQGLLGWSNQVQYGVPAIVFASNGLPYIALQASGPATAAQDPISSPAYWEQFNSSGLVVLSANQTWAVPMSMQLGYIRPRVTVIGGGGGGGSNASSGGGGGGGGKSTGVVSLLGVPTVSVVVGAGGAGATAGGASPAVTGGNTSFGAFMSATGGVGAVGAAGQDSGAGGVGSGGALNDTLGSGYQRSIGSGVVNSNVSGKGGGPGGGSAVEAGVITGNTAIGIGCGGGGGTGGAAGGAGKAGAVIIEW